MSIKGKKLAVVILEYLLISVLISLFVFCFLYFLSGSIVENYFWHHGIVLTEVQKRVFSVWLRSVCGLAGLIIFVVLFLFMLGQRLSYLIQIIQGVELLKEKEMETRIPLEGDDELTRLAETIYFVAASRRELDQRERQMQEEKEAWVRSMSHDIRTPLTSMVSYSELLLDKENPAPEELRDAVRLMHEKSLQIKELTDQLMGQEGIRWEDIEDIAFLFSQLVQEWEEILEERFTIRTDLCGLAALEGRMDIFSLKRIFDNLISNIEKYADEEKEIFLKVENQNRCVIITQENGIRRDERQEDSHRIGLANIRKLAQIYKGDMEAGEVDGTFRIRIRLEISPVLQNSSEISP